MTTGTRMFRTTLFIVLLCMCVPVVAVGIASALLTERASVESFHSDRTQQLTLLNNTCDLLLDECSFIYYQLIMDEDVERALNFDGVELPLPYAHLRSVQSLLHGMSLIVGSRPMMHSIVAYHENPHGLVISSRYGLVRLGTDPDRGWWEAYDANRDRAFFARSRMIDRAGMLTVYFSLANNLQQRDGVMVFHYRLSEMEALLPSDGSVWLVMDGDGTPLFSTGNGGTLTDALRGEILAMAPGESIYPQSMPDTVAYQVVSDAYGWRYVNLTDRALLSETAHSINMILLVVASLSLVVGVVIAVILSRRAARPIKRILSMIERMDADEDLPLSEEGRRDEYEIISYNLLESHRERLRMGEQLAQRQLRLQEAQMMALQAQINPHFLYNTMEIINWRAIRALGDANSISHMITTLSELLRYALERPDDLVPLSREMAHGEQYAELMTYRLGNIFHVTWDVPPAIRGMRVPKLILQPLIENAIQHGVQQMEGEGVVAITAQVRSGWLHLSVADNGAGMPEDLLGMLRDELASFDGLQYKHIGLFNVYQRVRLVTKDQAEMTIDSVEGTGTRVTLVFPAMQGGEEEHADYA